MCMYVCVRVHIYVYIQKIQYNITRATTRVHTNVVRDVYHKKNSHIKLEVLHLAVSHTRILSLIRT